MRLIGNGGGVVYAPLGPTHLAIEDIAILRAMPNMTIVAPCDAEEMARLMPQTVDHQGPLYIRLGKGGDPIVSTDAVPFADRPRHSDGRRRRRAARHHRHHAENRARRGRRPRRRRASRLRVLHMPTVKPLDVEAFLAHAARVDAIVAIEEHTIVGGLGSAVAEVVAEAGLRTGEALQAHRHSRRVPARLRVAGDHDGAATGSPPSAPIAVVRELLAARPARSQLKDTTHRPMGQLLNVVTPLHKRTTRDYLARMVDDKVHCMLKAKEYEFDYWDGDRRYGYGGYRYDGRWKPVAQQLIDHYKLGPNARILDVGCGKALPPPRAQAAAAAAPR